MLFENKFHGVKNNLNVNVANTRKANKILKIPRIKKSSMSFHREDESDVIINNNNNTRKNVPQKKEERTLERRLTI